MPKLELFLRTRAKFLVSVLPRVCHKQKHDSSYFFFFSANSVLMLFTVPRIFFLSEWGEKRLRGQVRRARGRSVLRRLLPFLGMASTEFLRGTFPLRNALIFAKWVIVQKWNCKIRGGRTLLTLSNQRWNWEHTRERRRGRGNSYLWRQWKWSKATRMSYSSVYSVIAAASRLHSATSSPAKLCLEPRFLC